MHLLARLLGITPVRQALSRQLNGTRPTSGGPLTATYSEQDLSILHHPDRNATPEWSLRVWRR